MTTSADTDAGERYQHPRLLSEDDYEAVRPVYAVWELTMKCDQPCEHCGSRAGPSRPRELSTEEALDVARSLARLGCRETVLIGGEAYLRQDVHEVIAELAKAGIRVTLQTGGRAFTPERARSMRDAGLAAVGVSIDGPARVHDKLRGNLGSHRAALSALDAARGAGLACGSNTQVNRLNWDMLPETAAVLRAHGVEAWQVQITVPMGRAADRPEWILEPWRIVDVIDSLARIQEQAAKEAKGGRPFDVTLGNNVGYFGPHELILRSRPGGDEMHYRGCGAGINVIGIESDGTVKGCPSLPTAPYAGGNVTSMSLETIWNTSREVRFARDRGTEELWGHCAECYYADTCRGGCSWTAHVTLGRRGNNPFCYHRVVELRKKGIRERLVQKERAPGEPYDFGRFELAEEPWPGEATIGSVGAKPPP
jgi:radical SAM protein with 4Fe4S-binding SPASM domain